MNELMDPATRENVLRNHTASGNGASVSTIVTVQEIPAVTRSPRFRADLPIPAVKYLDRKLRLVPDLRESGATSIHLCSSDGTWAPGRL